jgi:hypothetical protein
VGVFLLAVGTEDVAHDQDVELVGVASGFVVQRLECRGGKGSLAGEKEAAIFGGEEVVELWGGEAEIGFAFGSDGVFPNLEAGGLLGLEGNFEEFLVGEDFEGALEGRGGDVGGATEVVVAHAAHALPASEMPEAEVDGLFGGPEIGEHGAQELGEVHGMDIACERGEEEKGRGQGSVASFNLRELPLCFSTDGEMVEGRYDQLKREPI